jgi:hypothetical protein
MKLYFMLQLLPLLINDNTFTIVGSVGSKTVTATAATAKQHAAIANSVTAETGVTATAVN